MRIRTRRRAGFTIIELLVSMALIMTIMAILSAAFVAGLKTFGALRATADMSQKLRTATGTLRRDLNADHFDARIRPSDPGFTTTIVPREGFVRIYQGAPPGTEGTDGYNFSYLATSHVLHLAVKLRGNRPEDFFVTNVPGLGTAGTLGTTTTFFNQPADARYQVQDTQYFSQWAEVMYYLVPILNSSGTNVMTGPVGSGQPLYGLYRSQCLCVADNRAANAAGAAPGAGYSGMSTKPGQNPLNFNTPADLTTLANRALNPTALPVPTIDTLILSNVMSFTVRPILSPTPPGTMPAPANTSYDSAAPPLIPGTTTPAGLYGVEISIRIWDLKATQARQITIIQDL